MGNSHFWKGSDVIFNYQINTKGSYTLKFEEAVVDNTRSIKQLKENTNFQWDNPIGTIALTWVVSEPSPSDRITSTNYPIPSLKTVQETQKFFQRPSVCTTLGNKLKDVILNYDSRIHLIGNEYRGTCKVWYHGPIVFDLMKLNAQTVVDHDHDHIVSIIPQENDQSEELLIPVAVNKERVVIDLTVRSSHRLQKKTMDRTAPLPLPPSTTATATATAVTNQNKKRKVKMESEYMNEISKYTIG